MTVVSHARGSRIKGSTGLDTGRPDRMPVRK